MSAGDIARRVVVSGLVQGVGFRWNTAQQARAHGVRGWVRNLPDGRVEAHVAGSPESVEALIGWMRRGPRHARVEGVEVHAADPEPPGAHRGFEQR